MALEQGTVFPEFTVQRSTDLIHWTPIGGKVRGIEDRSGPRLNLSLDKAGGTSFYRVVADPNSQATDETGSGGAEVFGYGSRFAEELSQLSDEDWKARLEAGQKPPSPEWTRDYLIPSP